MHSLVEQVDAAVEPEEVVELGHEVAGNSAAGVVSATAMRAFGQLLRLGAAIWLPSAVGIFWHGVWRGGRHCEVVS